MKKVLALLVALVLCASTMSLAAFAADPTYPADTVAVIGTEKFDDLQDALDAVREGETVTLVKDIETNSFFELNGTVLVKGESTPIGKFTFDGNGHTITSTGGANANYYVLSCTDANVEIKNLNVTSLWGVLQIAGASQVKLTNCNFLADKTFDDNGTPKRNNANCMKVDQTIKGFLEINGGTYDGGAGTLVDVRGGQLVVRDGSFTSNNSGVLLQVGDLAAYTDKEESKSAGYIYGGTFTQRGVSSASGATICARAYKGATLAVYGGTFVQQMDGSKDLSKGSCVVTSSTSSAIGWVYVFGGNFYQTSSNVKSAMVYNGDVTKAAEIADKQNVYVLGGEFYSSVVEGRMDADMLRDEVPDTASALEKAMATILELDKTVVGMTKSEAVYDDMKMNKYSFAYQYSATKAPEGAKIMVTNPDNSVYYPETFWEAVNVYAQDGATVKLLDNITLTAECFLNNRKANLTLDLNGKKLDAADGVANALALQSGELTVKGGTLENKSGSAFAIGYMLADAEILNCNVLSTILTVKDCTVNTKAGEDAVAVRRVYTATVAYENATVNGTATNSEFNIPEKEAESTESTESSEVIEPGTTGESTTTEGAPTTEAAPSSETPTTEAPTTEPGTAKSEEKTGGCKSVVGVLAVLPVILAGAVIIRKKEEK